MNDHESNNSEIELKHKEVDESEEEEDSVMNNLNELADIEIGRRDKRPTCEKCW